jgi:Transglycosylase SLT domain
MSFEPLSTKPDVARVRQAIADAANRTGVDFSYLYNQARIESSLDPAAKAKTSSASGLFQFTRQTWLQTLKNHGGDHGLQWAADAILPGRRGLTVVDPQMRIAIDDLRFDPAASAAMAGEFASDNADHLDRTLGRPPESVDLYLAHFLGAGGATRFLSAYAADPATAAAPMFPDAAAANRTIFYTADGRARSVGEIRSSFAAQFRSPPPVATPPMAPQARWAATQHVASTTQSRAPMEMASFEAMPSGLSLDFAARAYQRLAGLGG